MTSEIISHTDDQKSRDVVLQIDELAHISLYRNNAFQVLQLPVRASPREINKRQQMAEIASRTGAPLSQGPGAYVVLSNTHEPSEIGKIARDLQDPLKRLFHEFFWLWVDRAEAPPMNLSGLPGLAQQINYWRLKQESDKTGVALHNLAVLTHAAALELEHDIAAKGGTSENIFQAKLYWEEAYSYWRSVQEHDKFWDLVTARIREMEDPQLTTGTSRRLRASIPGFLICIHARLFISSMEQNRENDGWRHINLIDSSKIDLKSVEDIIRRLLEPIRDRVKLFCDASRSKIETDNIHANKTVELLIAQCSLQLKIIDALLPQDSMVRSITFEDYADACLDGIHKFYQKTDDYKTSLSLLNQLKSQGMTGKALEQINVYTNQILEESKKGNYWHSAGYYELPQNTLALLEQAHDYCLIGQLEKAKDILIQLLEKEYPLGGISSDCVSTALAYCLNLLGLQHLDEGYQISQLERRSVIKIRNRAQNPTPGFNITANAIMSNTVEYWGRRFMLECMACGRIISGRYYIIPISNVKAIICPECQEQDIAERDSRRNQIKCKLAAAQNHFYTSKQLNNNNQIAQSNLEVVLKIMKDMDFVIPRSKMLIALPNKSSQKTPDRKEGLISTSPTNPPRSEPTPAVSDRATTQTPSRPRNSTSKETRTETNKDRSVIVAWTIFITTILVVVLLAIANGNVGVTYFL